MDSICKGLSAAETDFAALHLLEFNGRLKEKVTKDGFTYNLNDLYICQRLEFQFQGKTFKAFVATWADDITSTVAIPGPNGPIKGLLKIMDILNEERI
ncbi:baseplate hub distal subunit [Escherichia phage vB_EcoM_005]|uniref:Baseplate hub distal subunit n=1 Tax=Escherichia phage vB_EcoM_005 TaxID=2500761 RepID=A0A3Q9R902_9CAUD|nr:baseplate hub distal subunit [Escherichia phage vB_EcoM_005]AZV00923.1 baseplate hub distal subunit [Escherichia phage vB_EcoM_005]